MKKKAANTAATAQKIPAWMDARAVKEHFGISRATIYRIQKQGLIKTTSLRQSGDLRGKRLYSSDSIQALFDANATGGIEQ